MADSLSANVRHAWREGDAAITALVREFVTSNGGRFFTAPSEIDFPLLYGSGESTYWFNGSYCGPDGSVRTTECSIARKNFALTCPDSTLYPKFAGYGDDRGNPRVSRTHTVTHRGIRVKEHVTQVRWGERWSMATLAHTRGEAICAITPRYATTPGYANQNVTPGALSKFLRAWQLARPYEGLPSDPVPTFSSLSTAQPRLATLFRQEVRGLGCDMGTSLGDWGAGASLEYPRRNLRNWLNAAVKAGTILDWRFMPRRTLELNWPTIFFKVEGYVTRCSLCDGIVKSPDFWYAWTPIEVSMFQEDPEDENRLTPFLANRFVNRETGHTCWGEDGDYTGYANAYLLPVLNLPAWKVWIRGWLSYGPNIRGRSYLTHIETGETRCQTQKT